MVPCWFYFSFYCSLDNQNLTEAGVSPDTGRAGLPDPPPFAFGGYVPGSCCHFVGGVCSCSGDGVEEGPWEIPWFSVLWTEAQRGLGPLQVGSTLHPPLGPETPLSRLSPAPSGSSCPDFRPNRHRPSSDRRCQRSGKHFAARPRRELPALPPVPKVLRSPARALAALVAQPPRQGRWGRGRLSRSSCSSFETIT